MDDAILTSPANVAARSSARPADSLLFPWYDSVWLSQYTRARATLRRVRPALLPEFESALHVFRTPPDFQPRLLDEVFDAATMDRIRDVAATLSPNQLELHEARRFGRFIVHDNPIFTSLQQQTLETMSAAVGEPLEASYNFLSLYGEMGQCGVHMDSPEAKYTLDLCLRQSQEWPIYLSQPVPWPEPDGPQWPRENWEQKIKTSPALKFTPHILQPGKALIFSGSSQWHYREALPRTAPLQFCDLLFFHYIPRGTAELVKPRNWARLFGVPELEVPE